MREYRSQKIDDREQMTEVRRQKSEGIEFGTGYVVKRSWLDDSCINRAKGLEKFEQSQKQHDCFNLKIENTFF